MPTQQTFERVRRAIAGLDLSSENAQVAEREAEIQRFNEAIGRTVERREEIHRIIAARRDDRRASEGAAVADALLAGEDLAVATRESPPDEDLRTELVTLRNAVGDLEERVRSTRAGIEEIRSAAAQRAAECIDPLVHEISAELRQCAQRFLTGFAELSAISTATRGHTLDRLAAQKALPGIYSTDGLIPYQRRADVPSETVGVLRALEGKGASLPVRIEESVALP